MVAPEIYHKGGHRLQVESMERDLWVTPLQGPLQVRPPDQDHNGVGPQVDKLVEGTKLHQIEYGDCIS